MTKTTPASADVLSFLNAVEHPTRRADGLALYDMMARISGLSLIHI